MDQDVAVLFNEVVSLNQQLTEEFERLSQVVGKEGKIGQRARVRGASGGWETKLRAVNELIDDLAQPTAEVARVIGAVAKGDLSQSMVVEIEGQPNVRTKLEIAPLKDFRATSFKDYMVLGMIITGMPAVQAIPAVVAARPGIVTYADLLLVTATGFVTP